MISETTNTAANIFVEINQEISELRTTVLQNRTTIDFLFAQAQTDKILACAALMYQIYLTLLVANDLLMSSLLRCFFPFPSSLLAVFIILLHSSIIVRLLRKVMYSTLASITAMIFSLKSKKGEL